MTRIKIFGLRRTSTNLLQKLLLEHQPHPVDRTEYRWVHHLPDLRPLEDTHRPILTVKHPQAWIASMRAWLPLDWPEPDPGADPTDPHEDPHDKTQGQARVDLLGFLGDVWARYYGTALERAPERVVVCRYEDLLEDPSRELEELGEAVGFRPRTPVELPGGNVATGKEDQEKRELGTFGEARLRWYLEHGWRRMFREHDTPILVSALRDRPDLPLLELLEYELDLPGPGTVVPG